MTVEYLEMQMSTTFYLEPSVGDLLDISYSNAGQLCMAYQSHYRQQLAVFG